MPSTLQNLETRKKEILLDLAHLGDREPNIQITHVDLRGDRTLYLKHSQHNRKPLNESTQEVLKHLHRLWGFDVHLDSLSNDEITQSFHCPPKEPDNTAKN